MKKQLFDLTIEEFTSVLLDYQPTLEVSFCCYDEKGNFINKQLTDGKDEEVIVRGTYSHFYNAFLKEPCNNGLKQTVKEFLDTHFDYDMQLNRLDIYNYLEHITSNFHEERVRIVLREMDCFYQMVYLEEIDIEVQRIYREEGWEYPTIEVKLNEKRKKLIGTENDTIIEIDYAKMREKVYPCREFMYHTAIGVLRRKIQPIDNNQSNISDIHLSDKKGSIVNYLRVIDAMYEYGFFVTQTGEKALKKDVLKAFGNIVNRTFNNPSDNLNKGRESQNNDGNSKQVAIFDCLKEISMNKNKK